MELWKIAILGVTGLLVVAVLIESWLKRDQKKLSLLETLGNVKGVDPDDKPELGMEAIDMDIVRAAERMNTNLERNNTIYGRKSAFANRNAFRKK